jgi:hypothetical protein
MTIQLSLQLLSTAISRAVQKSLFLQQSQDRFLPRSTASRHQITVIAYGRNDQSSGRQFADYAFVSHVVDIIVYPVKLVLTKV